ncbi:MAG: ribonuclease BN [Geobacteraceae bacterium GWC2_58_44]|nr:MAG: ribonuclease BN [Geobacteraceae bacterium GWC2_58_44]HBG05881.1 ribonuclease BN [Geobacter sp.]
MNRSSGKRRFFSKSVWELDPDAAGGVKGRSIQFLQFISFASSNFFANNSLLRATALSFTTLLSIVPLLALAFSVLKGLGAQNRLAPLLLNQMAAGSEVVVTRVISYIDNTNMGSVGAIGIVALLYTSINMLGNIEEAFNSVWGVAETRTFYRKFSDYLSVLVSAPLLMLAATSITTTLQSQRLVDWLLEYTYLGDLFLLLLGFTPYLIVWTALFLLYIFIPNTRVRYRSALVGAVLAGTLWQLAQWCYINFQVGAGNYNAIYGTLAALPILMVWIYVSWSIVIFGMEVVAAHQNLRTFRRDIRGSGISHSLKELVALAALRHVAAAFHEGGPGWGEQHLAVKLRMPVRIVRDTLLHLTEAGFLVQGARGTYYPARELDRIALAQVLLSLKSRGATCTISGEEQAQQILETVDDAVRTALQGVTVKDLASGEKIPPDVDKGGSVDI